MSKCNQGEAPAHPLIVIVGPTASGKSDLALAIAQSSHAEIVSFDSVQVYRGFDIGSAKVPLSERRGVPHHLIDIAEPDRLFTAGEYARAARSKLWDVAGRGHLPILVGGTGFYLRALLDGLSPAPERDQALRAALTARETRRPGSLHRILCRLNRGAAERVHPNDTQKVVRALELCMVRRRSPHDPKDESRDALTGFQVFKLGLHPARPALCDRINARVADMFDRGLIEEVLSLLARGIPRTAKPFESLGYSQALAHLENKLPLEEAIRATQQATRQYAKRQMTWFRRERDVHWLPGFGTSSDVQTEALALVGPYLPARRWIGCAR